MPTKKKKTPLVHGDGHGAAHGESTVTPTVTPTEVAVEKPPKGKRRLTFDAFIERLAAEQGALLGDVYLSGTVEGDSVGATIGHVPLQPLHELEERVIDEAGGPRGVILRAKKRSGLPAFEGFMEIEARLPSRADRAAPKPAPAAPAAPSDGGVGAALANVAVRAVERQLEPQTPEKVTTARDAIGQIKDLAEVMKTLKADVPAAAAATGLSVAEVKELIAIGEDQAKKAAATTAAPPGLENSVVLACVRELKKPLETIVDGLANVIAMKIAKKVGGA